MHTATRLVVTLSCLFARIYPFAHGLSVSGASGLSKPSLLAALATSPRDLYVLVDVENVRGRSDFALSHGRLLDRTAVWATKRGLRGRVALVVDHGSEPTGHHLPHAGLAVVFSGDRRKADDVIVRDVAYAQRTLGLDVLCVTRDRDLIRRCHRVGTTGTKKSEILPPKAFLDDLESAMAEHDAEEEEAEAEGEREDEREGERLPSGLLDEMAGNLEQEMHLWGDVIRCEAQLGRHPNPNSEDERSEISAELERHRQRLAQLNDGRPHSVLERVAAIDPAAPGERSFSREVQDELVSRWHDRRRRSLGYAERTGDRIVLAEMLRRQLREGGQGGEGRDAEPAALHARHANAIAAGLPGASASVGETLLEGTINK